MEQDLGLCQIVIHWQYLHGQAVTWCSKFARKWYRIMACLKRCLSFSHGFKSGHWSMVSHSSHTSAMVDMSDWSVSNALEMGDSCCRRLLTSLNKPTLWMRFCIWVLIISSFSAIINNMKGLFLMNVKLHFNWLFQWVSAGSWGFTEPQIMNIIMFRRFLQINAF